ASRESRARPVLRVASGLRVLRARQVSQVASGLRVLRATQVSQVASGLRVLKATLVWQGRLAPTALRDRRATPASSVERTSSRRVPRAHSQQTVPSWSARAAPAG